ncbi:MAG TPA: adenylate/guanylate cyclase domain-containing protein [Solirubrobacteraceae bacterium]|nr:adenylate/guanylate cyclase domain-containing protein [Solirubrobacteraceae bacterium]
MEPSDTDLLIDYLEERGATADELADAVATGSLGALALELALRGAGELLPFEEAASTAGLDVEAARELWCALGFPDPKHRQLRVTPKQIQTLRLLAEMSGPLGAETGLQLARVMGSSMAQLAEAIVVAFRVKVEMPRRDHGEPYSEVVRDYSQTASIVLPALADALGEVLTEHLLSVSRSNWALDERRAAVTRELGIGFADLVEYTRVSRLWEPAELASAIARFEALVREVLTRYPARVVKLIGDEIMFAVDDVSRAADLVRELIEELAADRQLPPVRVGLAAGRVVSYQGDYYGDVVNLAARLVKAADPRAALVSGPSMKKATSSRDLEMVEMPVLKGYEGAVRVYKLLSRKPSNETEP